MNRKLMPLVLMLIAGLISSVLTFYMGYNAESAFAVLLAVLIIFYILGSVIKYLLDTFDKQNEQKSLDEGEVISKESDTETTETGAKTVRDQEQDE